MFIICIQGLSCGANLPRCEHYYLSANPLTFHINFLSKLQDNFSFYSLNILLCQNKLTESTLKSPPLLFPQTEAVGQKLPPTMFSFTHTQCILYALGVGMSTKDPDHLRCVSVYVCANDWICPKGSAKSTCVKLNWKKWESLYFYLHGENNTEICPGLQARSRAAIFPMNVWFLFHGSVTITFS